MVVVVVVSGCIDGGGKSEEVVKSGEDLHAYIVSTRGSFQVATLTLVPTCCQ